MTTVHTYTAKFNVCCLIIVLSPVLLAAGCTSLAGSENSTCNLVFKADFEDGKLDQWQLTDPAAWRIEQANGGKVLSLFKESSYRAQVRSPFGIALVKDVVVGSFVMDLQMFSTKKDYPHRSLCLFFGHQDPTHYYYVHIAKNADPVANTILVVDGKDRVTIAKTTSKGTEWGTGWHNVRLVRDIDKGTIELFFDDMTKPIMTAVDHRFKAGRVGVGSFDDTGRFDNIKIHAIKSKSCPSKN